MKRRYSLKRNKEFRYVYRTGKSVACRCLVIVFRRNNTGLLRVGFSVSKKIGNSVTRNLIKRRMRSAFDTFIHDVDPNFNIIIIARQPILGCNFNEISEAFEYTLKKAGLLYLNNKEEKDCAVSGIEKSSD